MTPEEAWKHVKALWPDATGLSRDEWGTSIHFQNRNSGLNARIDWPEGVTQWPPPEPQYREPKMPEDFDKEIEVQDSESQKWFAVRLAGFARDYAGPCKWIAADGTKWRYARIRVDDDGWKPMESAPKDKRILAKMGDRQCLAEWCKDNSVWFSLGAGKGSDWDRDNQPTAWKEIE